MLLSSEPAKLDVEIKCFALGGLSLMEQLIGYDRVIIIDAIQTSGGQIGQVHQLTIYDLPEVSTGHTTAIHDMSLPAALQVGREMQADLPEEIFLVGIEADRVYEFSEELSPAVEAAIPEAKLLVLSLIS